MTPTKKSNPKENDGSNKISFDTYKLTLETNFQSLDQVSLEKKTKVHIFLRMQGKRKITDVMGVDSKYNYDLILHNIKKIIGCNGCIKAEGNGAKVLSFSGDQRTAVLQFLVEENIHPRNCIEVHGA